MLINAASGMAADGADGAEIQQQGDGEPSLRSWYVLALAPGTYEVIASYDIVPNQKTEALAVPDGAGAGAHLIQQDFVTGTRQHWQIRKVP